MSQPIEAQWKAYVDLIEETYEFMLAYAAQGRAGEEAQGPGSQIHDALTRCHDALEHLPTLLQTLVEAKQLEPVKPYHAFIAIVARDAQDSQTAMQLVLAQRTISSQLIDNLNAWIHLRTLLTDLFVIDDILKGQ